MDNKRQGQGIKQWLNGDKYQGLWKNDERDGQGLFTWSNGNTYDG